MTQNSLVLGWAVLDWVLDSNMPKFKFICPCGQEEVAFVSPKTNHILCDTCGSEMIRQLPNIGGQEVRETIDHLTNTRWKQDQKEILGQRKEEYFWKVEVPRLVQTYSLETCLQEGWLKYNEKGELVIGTAPSKR